MKRLKPLFLAIISGIVCATALFNNIRGESEEEVVTNAVGVQIGAFTKEENAIKLRDNYGGIVICDNDIYRVYYSILTDEVNLNSITSLLKDSGVNYILKNINLSDDVLDKLEVYESKMSDESDSIIKINRELLKSIEEVI